MKLISADQLVLQAATDIGKGNVIVQAFEDAYKVPEALIILDGLEMIVQYNSIQRFNSTILQIIVPLLKRGSGKIIVLATTSDFMGMKDIRLAECFDSKVYVGPLMSSDITEVVARWKDLHKIDVPDVADLHVVKERLSSNVSIGIKQLLLSLEFAAGGLEEGDKKEINETAFEDAFRNFVPIYE